MWHHGVLLSEWGWRLNPGSKNNCFPSSHVDIPSVLELNLWTLSKNVLKIRWVTVALIGIISLIIASLFSDCYSSVFLLCFGFVFATFWWFPCYPSSLVIVFMLLDMSLKTPRSLVCTFRLFPGLHGFQLDLTSLLVCYLPTSLLFA